MTQDPLKSNAFNVLRCFSTGIVVGVAFMHLFPDAASGLQDASDYPLVYAIAVSGIWFMLTTEHVFICLGGSHRNHENGSSSETKDIDDSRRHDLDHDHDHSHSHQHHHITYRSSKSDGYELTDVRTADNKEIGVLACEECNQAEDEAESASTASRTLPLITVSSNRKALVKTIIMEIAVAIHSVIIGFDMGTMTQDDLSTIKTLMVAFLFHQFFEGVSLGTAITESRLGFNYVLIFGFIFAFMLPLGIILGITATSSSAGNMIRNIANAFAAGSLIYTGLIEMAAEDFSDPTLSRRPYLKFTMILATVLGSTFMAILAIWA